MQSLQRRIDQAFEDVAPDTGAGFGPTRIPLTYIPAALQKLDLHPDDEQVLAVFRNAASGWSKQDSREVDAQADEGQGWVNIEDWRAVCAVLLEPREEEDSEGDAESGDQYVEDDDDDDDNDDDDDEYMDEVGLSSSRRHTHKNARAESESVSSPPGPRKLTKRQREVTLEAFALFFPDIKDQEELEKRRIMIKDIQRVAGVLGEKIKAEEMVEMLEVYSTSPDKSVGLEDFGRIMLTARLA